MLLLYPFKRRRPEAQRGTVVFLRPKSDLGSLIPESIYAVASHILTCIFVMYLSTSLDFSFLNFPTGSSK